MQSGRINKSALLCAFIDCVVFSVKSNYYCCVYCVLSALRKFAKKADLWRPLLVHLCSHY